MTSPGDRWEVVRRMLRGEPQLGRKLMLVALFLLLLGVGDYFLQLPANLFGRELQNALHYPAYALLLVLLARLFPRCGAVVLLLACVGVGVLLEAWQYFRPRDASLADVGRNLLGAAIGLIAVRGPLAGVRGAALAGTLLLVALAAPVRILLAYQHRDALFPHFLDPHTVLASPLVTSNSVLTVETAPAGWAGHAGRDLVQVCWSGDRYPGLHFNETVADWRGFRTLVVDLAVTAGTPVQLTVAVGHEGIEGTSAFVPKLFEPGLHTWRIPLTELAFDAAGEPVRLTHIVLHSRREHAGRCVSFADVRLE